MVSAAPDGVCPFRALRRRARGTPGQPWRTPPWGAARGDFGALASGGFGGWGPPAREGVCPFRASAVPRGTPTPWQTAPRGVPRDRTGTAADRDDRPDAGTGSAGRPRGSGRGSRARLRVRRGHPAGACEAVTLLHGRRTASPSSSTDRRPTRRGHGSYPLRRATRHRRGRPRGSSPRSHPGVAAAPTAGPTPPPGSACRPRADRPRLPRPASSPPDGNLPDIGPARYPSRRGRPSSGARAPACSPPDGTRTPRPRRWIPPGPCRSRADQTPVAPTSTPCSAARRRRSSSSPSSTSTRNSSPSSRARGQVGLSRLYALQKSCGESVHAAPPRPGSWVGGTGGVPLGRDDHVSGGVPSAALPGGEDGAGHPRPLCGSGPRRTAR